MCPACQSTGRLSASNDFTRSTESNTQARMDANSRGVHFGEFTLAPNSRVRDVKHLLHFPRCLGCGAAPLLGPITSPPLGPSSKSGGSFGWPLSLSSTSSCPQFVSSFLLWEPRLCQDRLYAEVAENLIYLSFLLVFSKGKRRGGLFPSAASSSLWLPPTRRNSRFERKKTVSVSPRQLGRSPVNSASSVAVVKSVRINLWRNTGNPNLNSSQPISRATVGGLARCTVLPPETTRTLRLPGTSCSSKGYPETWIRATETYRFVLGSRVCVGVYHTSTRYVVRSERNLDGQRSCVAVRGGRMSDGGHRR